MATRDHLRILAKGVAHWNRWRGANPDLRPDLAGARLERADLRGANLRHANLRGARLAGADLSEARLWRADLTGANLSGARLRDADAAAADFTEANLAEADLSSAHLVRTVLQRAQLRRARFVGVELYETNFAGTDLRDAVDLARARHLGPSVVDARTLTGATELPIEFLRGVGLPNAWIPGALQLPRRPTCYISHAEADAAFATRLHDDLQESGVRCWLVPDTLKAGAPLPVTVESASIPRERLLVVFSAQALAGAWIGPEIEHALAEEREQKATVLYAARLDDAIFSTKAGWSKAALRRPVADFSAWRESDDAYGKALEELLDALASESRSESAATARRAKLQPPFSLGEAT